MSAEIAIIIIIIIVIVIVIIISRGIVIVTAVTIIIIIILWSWPRFHAQSAPTPTLPCDRQVSAQDLDLARLNYPSCWRINELPLLREKQ